MLLSSWGTSPHVTLTTRSAFGGEESSSSLSYQNQVA